MTLLTETPPRYPDRSEARLHAAFERLKSHDWTRLEGAPETEAALKAYHGGGEVWYISSGTAALQAVLLGHGIGPGDEVITTPYTWGATVSAILSIGAVPIFADILPNAPVMDPESIPDRVTSRTRALLPVHLFGHPCDMPALKKVADHYGLYLFEDGSQAHGARLHGEPVGRGGDGAAFSCMGLKPLAGTEGGYAVFADAKAAEAAYLYGKHPRGLSPSRAEHLKEAGLLDALQLGWRPCAVGAELVRSGLETLDAENEGRRINAEGLRKRLESIPGLSMDDALPGAEPIWHLMSIRIDPERIKLTPAECAARLEPTGLSCFHYIPIPIHRLPRMQWQTYTGPRVFWHHQLKEAGVDYRTQSCPQAEKRSLTSFEMGWNWTDPNSTAMDQIAECLKHLVSD